MNRNKLYQIFQQYINKFEELNSGNHKEYFKWQAAHEFPGLMKKALAAGDEEFSRALYEVKKATVNIIDSYTQPFAGLVEFAKTEPDKVRRMLMDLYSDDGGDLKVQMQKIAEFFRRSEELSKDSFLFKQNSHSVSALLFLNDPDHHYMYKATQSKAFADCVEFYDDWGTGDNIKLDVYYRMCDELVSEIKNCKELLDVDASRFDGRLKISGGALHPDKEKHLLAFDIIYCSTVYDLYSGFSYTKRDMKEKQVYLAGKAKAELLKQEYDKAKTDMDALTEIKEYLDGAIHVGDEIKHVKNGIGTVTKLAGNHITISFPNREAEFGLMTLLANNLVSIDKDGFKETVSEYREIIKRHEAIPRALDYAAGALEPYEEYLD